MAAAHSAADKNTARSAAADKKKSSKSTAQKRTSVDDYDDGDGATGDGRQRNGIQ